MKKNPIFFSLVFVFICINWGCASKEVKNMPQKELIVEYFCRMDAPQANKTVIIKNPQQITLFEQYHSLIPEKGDISLKLAPSTPLYRLQLTLSELPKTVSIYDDKVQCADTAFLEKENEAEKKFIQFVKELIK